MSAKILPAFLLLQAITHLKYATTQDMTIFLIRATEVRVQASGPTEEYSRKYFRRSRKNISGVPVTLCDYNAAT